MDQETADYIIRYFSDLQNEKEKLTSRHISSLIKLDYPNANLNATTRIYKKIG